MPDQKNEVAIAVMPYPDHTLGADDVPGPPTVYFGITTQGLEDGTWQRMRKIVRHPPPSVAGVDFMPTYLQADGYAIREAADWHDKRVTR